MKIKKTEIIGAILFGIGAILFKHGVILCKQGVKEFEEAKKGERNVCHKEQTN